MKQRMITTKSRLSFLILVILLFLISMEFLYSPGSGTYNAVILVLLCGVLTGLRFVLGSGKLKIKRSDLMSFFLLIWIVLWGDKRESLRYAMTLYIIWLLTKLPMRDLRKLHIWLICIGTMCTAYMLLTAPGQRAIGYFAGSPTLFSYSMCISIYYLLFSAGHRKKDYILCAFAMLCIILTESRTTILAAAGIIGWSIARDYFSTFKKQLPIAIVIATAVALIGVIVFLRFFDVEQFMYGRGNARASSETRMGMIMRFVNQLRTDPVMLMIGKGGGYTVNLLTVGDSHLPLHQDILMLVCEYGLLGFAAIVLLFFVPLQMNWLMWAILITGSFHNIIISPISILCFVTAVRSINQEHKASTNCKFEG